MNISYEEDKLDQFFLELGKIYKFQRKHLFFFFNEKLNKNGSEVLISREDAIQKIIGRMSSLISSTEKGQKEKRLESLTPPAKQLESLKEMYQQQKKKRTSFVNVRNVICICICFFLFYFLFFIFIIIKNGKSAFFHDC